MRTGIAFLLAALAAQAQPRPAVPLVAKTELEAARSKAARFPWAGQALERLTARAEEALARPLDIPARGGQWPHWYSCAKDGAQLVTDSPTRHRCPVCGQVYSGDPYDSVVLYHVHMRNAEAARALALASRLTGRRDFSKRAALILSGYADRYRAYPRHNTRGEDKVGGGKLMAQTLDESVWLIQMAWAYSMIQQKLTAAERKHINEDLFLPAADAIREHRMGIHNIQCWKNSAVGLAGLVTGRHELLREAIDDPDRGFRVQIQKGVTADGLWWEGSLGYHFYTMQALWPLAEGARLAGVDLYDERYARLYEAPLALALPGGDAPGFNDSAGGNLAAVRNLYELAYARWPRPAFGRVAASGERDSVEALLYGAAGLPAGPIVPLESALLPQAGFAMLRSNDAAVAIRFGSHGGGHGHPDKLNIVTHGGGQLFGLDPGSINYGVPLFQEWYRTTIAHNTVAVDQKSQAAKDGRLESWRAPGSIAASAEEVYPGVALKRELHLDGKRLEDRFACESATEHTYDWAFHAAGRLTLSLPMEAASGPAGESDGYQHIQLTGRARTDSDFTARWDNGGTTLTLRVKAAPGTEVLAGAAPGRNPADKIPMLILRRRAASTAFEVIHEWAPSR